MYHKEVYTHHTMNRSQFFPRDFVMVQAVAQSDLSLRQLGALRRLDGLPDAVESGDSVVNGVNAAAVRPVMCEVACATDMDEDAVDEMEALKSELEALKQQQKQDPKEYADKGVPCSDDESDPAQEVPQEVPQVPTLALLDKDSLICVSFAGYSRLLDLRCASNHENTKNGCF